MFRSIDVESFFGIRAMVTVGKKNGWKEKISIV